MPHTVITMWSGGFESSPGCQNNVSIGPTVPKDIEWYQYPACSGAVLGPWTCWSMRKWDHRRARKRRLFPKVSWTWAGLGSLAKIYEEGLDVGWVTSNGQGGKVLVTPQDRLRN